jgi:hypothetical protein
MRTAALKGELDEEFRSIVALHQMILRAAAAAVNAAWLSMCADEKC